MKEKYKIAVRYCGGCNSGYDRVSAVKRLADRMPDSEFVTAQPGIFYDAAVIVCGCAVQCARADDLAVASYKRVMISGWADLIPAREKLEEILQESSACELTHEEIMQILPHRDPVMFVDRVTKLVRSHEIVADTKISPDWEMFKGHFPGNPVLPGTVIMEAAAQVSGILALYEDQTGESRKQPLLTGIKEAVFRKKIYPGDRMTIHAESRRKIAELGFYEFYVQVFVKQELTAEMELRLTVKGEESNGMERTL